MSNIAILASGSGTNAENIIRFFSNRNSASVKLVLSNRCEASVLKRAEALGVESRFFDRNDFFDSGKVLGMLIRNNIDFVVLAGFLWLVPDVILDKFERRIINIHPALLPRYGGKGMYGDRVHMAVLENHDRETGITIHFVNKNYDEGDIIFQAKCRVEENDTVKSLAARVHSLEYEHYPVVIEKLILNLQGWSL